MRYYSGMNNSPETAKQWLAKIGQNREGAGEAFVAGLSGHLGAGKTAFVKLVAKELGIEEVVTSPTFVIMKIYEAGNNGPFKRLVHIDAYRLERRKDLEALRFEGIAADPKNLVMVEWPENVRLAVVDLNTWLKFEIHGGAYTVSVQTEAEDFLKRSRKLK